jgi:hypothetical protein
MKAQHQQLTPFFITVLLCMNACTSIPIHTHNARVKVDPPFSITNAQEVHLAPAIARGENETPAQALQMALESRLSSHGILVSVLSSDECTSRCTSKEKNEAHTI